MMSTWKIIVFRFLALAITSVNCFGVTYEKPVDNFTRLDQRTNDNIEISSGVFNRMYGDDSKSVQHAIDNIEVRHLLEAIEGKSKTKERIRKEVAKIFKRHTCQDLECKKRRCKHSDKPRKRHFTLYINPEFVMSLSACGDCPNNVTHCSNPGCVTGNGINRICNLINGKLGGPTLEVCLNDILVIDVLVQVSDTLFHWHGITQKNTPFMDGVAHLTQCRAITEVPYRYEFVASDLGTHFYYSSVSLGHLEGTFGALVVRSRNDPWGWMYKTEEHVIVFNEWTEDAATLLQQQEAVAELPTKYLIINSKGAVCTSVDDDASDSSSDNSVTQSKDKCTNIPLSEFWVNKGKYHRLRLINAGFLSCPIQFQIESHKMMVIAADGSPVRPLLGIKTIIMLPGERYDVIVHANRPVNTYLIIIKGLGDCEANKVYQRALLKYKGTTQDFPTNPNPGYRAYPVGHVLNPLDEHCIGGRDRAKNYESDEPHHKRNTCAYKLKYLRYKNEHDSSEEGESRSSRRHVKVDLEFSIVKYIDDDGVEQMRASFNEIQLALPMTLVYGKTNIASAFPNLQCLKDETKETCLHRIKLRIGDEVDIIIRDKDHTSRTPNAFHLHGYKFKLLYQGHDLEDAHNAELFERHPSLRDTVVVPAGGVVRIRFIADNPGLWLLHSTREMVREAGLGVILQVGDTNQFLMAPENAPQCEN